MAAAAAGAVLVGAGVVAGSGTAGAVYVSPVTAEQTVENISVVRGGLGDVYGLGARPAVRIGGDITFTTTFSVREGDERLVTRIADHGPAGFEYVPGSATVEYRDASGAIQRESVTPEVGAGAVTVRAPGTGWPLSAAPAKGVVLTVTYRAPLLSIPSEVDGGGVTFDVAGRGEGMGWTAMGLPVDVNLPSSVDSLGSSSFIFGS